MFSQRSERIKERKKKFTDHAPANKADSHHSLSGAFHKLLDIFQKVSRNFSESLLSTRSDERSGPIFHVARLVRRFLSTKRNENGACMISSQAGRPFDVGK